MQPGGRKCVPGFDLSVFSLSIGNALVFSAAHIDLFRLVIPADRVSRSPSGHKRRRSDPESIGAGFLHMKFVFRKTDRAAGGGFGPFILQKHPTRSSSGPPIGESRNPGRKIGLSRLFPLQPDRFRQHGYKGKEKSKNHSNNELQTHDKSFQSPQLLSVTLQLKPNLPQYA